MQASWSGKDIIRLSPHVSEKGVLVRQRGVLEGGFSGLCCKWEVMGEDWFFHQEPGRDFFDMEEKRARYLFSVECSELFYRFLWSDPVTGNYNNRT